MIVRRLLAWLETADSARRAEAAAALARAYLDEDLDHDDLLDAETALTALLDDPAIKVRRAMARALATSPHAPAHVIAALAADHSLVSGRVLTHSPLLTDEDLIDCLAVADGYAQVAIALRPSVSTKVAGAIVETGAREAMIALAVNESAHLGETAMLRIVERHGADGEVREALLGRTGLPATVRDAIARRTAMALHAFVAGAGWLSEQRADRACRDGCETAAIELAARDRAATKGGNPVHFVRHLRQTGQLTPALLLRALISADRALFEAALAVLSGIDAGRVSGLVRAWSGPGFSAVYAKAGLPANLLGAFRAALAAQDATGLVFEAGQTPRLSGVLIERTLRACEAGGSPELRRVNALLHRLRAEAARNEARSLARDMVDHVRTAQLAKPVAFGNEAPIVTANAPERPAPVVEIDIDAIAAEMAKAPEGMAA